MRYGIISDVHANLAALDAVLAALAAARVDRVLCAGDLVGYGPHPNECVARLADLGVASVAGNHDLIAIGRLSLERTDALARRTLEWTRSELSATTRDQLSRLPATIADGPVTVAHGSLEDPERYVRSAETSAQQLDRLAEIDPEASVLVLGHTHVARAYSARRGAPQPWDRGRRVAIERSDRMLLNPGSVGQPRERRAVCRFLLLDTSRGEARFRAVRYDDERTRRALLERGLPPEACHRKPTVRGQAARLKGRLSGR